MFIILLIDGAVEPLPPLTPPNLVKIFHKVFKKKIGLHDIPEKNFLFKMKFFPFQDGIF